MLSAPSLHARGWPTGLLFICLTATWSCAASRAVRPVGAHHLAAGASIGGPLFTNLAVPVPTPLVTAFARYGLTDCTDVDLGLFLPVSRVQGIDVGAAHLLQRPRGLRPALMAGGRLALFANAQSLIGARDAPSGKVPRLQPRLFEEVYVNASWDLTPAMVGYLGADLFMQAQNGTLRPSLALGAIWRVTAPLSLQAEAKWLGFTHNTEALSIHYVTLRGYGAIGLQLSLTYQFGRVPAQQHV
jgi:hypothetical protein